MTTLDYLWRLNIPLILWICAFMMGRVTLRCRTSWIGAFLHPIGVMLVMAIALRSWWLSHQHGVAWKDRTYKLNTRL